MITLEGPQCIVDESSFMAMPEFWEHLGPHLLPKRIKGLKEKIPILGHILCTCVAYFLCEQTNYKLQKYEISCFSNFCIISILCFC